MRLSIFVNHQEEFQKSLQFQPQFVVLLVALSNNLRLPLFQSPNSTLPSTLIFHCLANLLLRDQLQVFYQTKEIELQKEPSKEQSHLSPILFLPYITREKPKLQKMESCKEYNGQ